MKLGYYVVGVPIVIQCGGDVIQMLHAAGGKEFMTSEPEYLFSYWSSA